MKIAKADLVPTDHNLRDEYRTSRSWRRRASSSWRRSTRARTASRVGHRSRCSARSMSVCTGCRGCRTRSVSGRRARSTGSRRSRLAARSTRSRTSWWTSGYGSGSTAQKLIVVHVDGSAGPREVARHELTTPGRPAHLTSTTRPSRPARLTASRGRAAWRSARSSRSARAPSGG